ncbi:hypothetical protein L2E82_47373 [Cichorium intybus]|uniref:Uncharacterized protein n=1 Tax=Cichorium intybus TaxID=13427 RepID=A0ACB8YV65_CICIN|nr:hypothetical protein L2E82_47373 [Cichorium intybus]
MVGAGDAPVVMMVMLQQNAVAVDGGNTGGWLLFRDVESSLNPHEKNEGDNDAFGIMESMDRMGEENIKWRCGGLRRRGGAVME